MLGSIGSSNCCSGIASVKATERDRCHIRFITALKKHCKKPQIAQIDA